MRVFKTFAVTLLLTLAACIGAYAQNRTVSGKILDNQQQPLIGAAVMISGTNTGTTTDVDGNFSMSVPSGDVVLEVSSLGYITRKVSVPATKSSVNVTLEEDNMTLNETVVVGYGTQKKVNLTGAISVVDDKQLQDRSSHNLSTMLQGSVPGLNITTSSGVPGSSATLNIRGVASINGIGKSETAPLVLIDGVEGDIARVNPNDVQSISVIKDISAAAVYGARAAFGVVLVTTKSGKTSDGKAKARVSAKWGWEQPTTSTDFISSGYWGTYIHNLFWQTAGKGKYINYTDDDMAELLARVNDKTENPDRPWVVVQNRGGKDKYVYYANTDWYHELFTDTHPTQQYNVSFSGGSKGVNYYVSGAYDRQVGILKQNPDVYNKYNMRAKLDFNITKWAKLSNNTSYYSSTYKYVGVGGVENAIAYSATHALPMFPLKNPDGSWVAQSDFIMTGSGRVANGRHIVFGNKDNINHQFKTDFSNTTELKITPFKTFNIVANFTYRTYQNRNTSRTTNIVGSSGPTSEDRYVTGAGKDALDETIKTWNYYATNIFATYEETFNKAHHVTAMVGFNYETQNSKRVWAEGQHLLSNTLSDLDLVGPDDTGAIITSVSGGQSEYALAGVFGRLNYDFKGRYLAEISGRYDGSSRFASGSRWGFFPSASLGWRISEEPWLDPTHKVVSNLKLRASMGSLGNQNVSNYQYLRTISLHNFSGITFGGNTPDKYASITSPNASDLTWEVSRQYNVGVDASFLQDRLSITAEGYARTTEGMLSVGLDLPAVYGATAPKTNSSDLRTTGYELSFGWRDQIRVANKPLGYFIKATLSDYKSVITKYSNDNKSLAADPLYYKGMRLGEIWGFEVDGLFATDEEAQEYANKVDLSYFNMGYMPDGWRAGDLRFVDLDGDGKISFGSNTVDKPGDRKVIGNSLPSLQYGFSFGFDFYGFDFSAFFQGTGNHYWYPTSEARTFWGPYGGGFASYIQKDFMKKVWSEDNPDAYFPRPRAYYCNAGKSPLAVFNTKYLQNVRYLRFKNLTVGYTVPQNLTKKIGIEKVRAYFTGENLAYWSPIKKINPTIDPEGAFTRYESNGDVSDMNRLWYPWQKTFTFGIDITF